MPGGSGAWCGLPYGGGRERREAPANPRIEGSRAGTAALTRAWPPGQGGGPLTSGVSSGRAAAQRDTAAHAAQTSRSGRGSDPRCRPPSGAATRPRRLPSRACPGCTASASSPARAPAGIGPIARPPRRWCWRPDAAGLGLVYGGASVGLMGVAGRRRPGGRRRGRRRDPAGAGRPRDRPPGADRAARGRHDARAQGADGRARRRLRRAAGRVRHARGALRDLHVVAARPARQAVGAAQRRAATTTGSRASSTTPSPRASCAPSSARRC